MSANVFSHSARSAGSRGRNTMPTPYSPGPGREIRSPAATSWQEGVRHLEEDAGAVAGVDLATAGAAVVEVAEGLERLLDDGVGFLALDMDDKADAAGVVLELRVVKALPGRRRCAHPAGNQVLLSVTGHCCGDQRRLFVYF